jgi:hypothetical protein
MMASGMNGQSFTFHGYLPIEKGKKSSPKKSRENFAGKNQSQILLKLPTETIKCWKISYRLYILKPICVLLLILLYQPNISKRREHLPGKRKHRSAQQTLHFIIQNVVLLC